MLRNKIVIVGAGSLLLLAGAAGASAQGHASDRSLTAAGRVAGVRVATTVATAVKPLAASTAHRTAAPVRTVKSSAKANNGQSGQDEQGDNENEQECSTTLPGGTETDGQDDQGENERDQQCSTAAGQPQGQDEHDGMANENDHESGDSQHGSGGGDQGGSGDQGDGSGGGGD